MEGRAGVLTFDADAAEAGLSFDGEAARLPFPRTLVEVPGYEGVAVCLAEDPAGVVRAGCAGPVDHAAEEAGLRLASFVAASGRAFGDDGQGRRRVVCEGSWEPCQPPAEPAGDGAKAVAVTVGERPEGGARGPLGHPRHSPRRHTVRGFYRWQPCGEGNSERRRTYVASHERGGGTGMAEGSLAGGGRVWHVSLAQGEGAACVA